MNKPPPKKQTKTPSQQKKGAKKAGNILLVTSGPSTENTAPRSGSSNSTSPPPPPPSSKPTSPPPLPPKPTHSSGVCQYQTYLLQLYQSLLFVPPLPLLINWRYRSLICSGMRMRQSFNQLLQRSCQSQVLSLLKPPQPVTNLLFQFK